MKICVQRVLEAKVICEDDLISSIKKGYVLFVCLENGDNVKTLQEAAEKIRKLRIFENEDHRMNLDITQVNGEILSISQFTLSWDGSGGHRPSFDKSLDPATARLYYLQFNKFLREHGINVCEGRFGADMKVHLLNDGPVTFFLEFH